MSWNHWIPRPGWRWSACCWCTRGAWGCLSERHLQQKGLFECYLQQKCLQRLARLHAALCCPAVTQAVPLPGPNGCRRYHLPSGRSGFVKPEHAAAFREAAYAGVGTHANQSGRLLHAVAWVDGGGVCLRQCKACKPQHCPGPNPACPCPLSHCSGQHQLRRAGVAGGRGSTSHHLPHGHEP